MKQLQAVVENRTGFCLDPRTKLLLMAVVATAEFLYSHTAFMIAVAMIPFVLLLTNRQYKTATVFFCLFAAGLFVQASRKEMSMTTPTTKKQAKKVISPRSLRSGRCSCENKRFIGHLTSSNVR